MNLIDGCEECESFLFPFVSIPFSQVVQGMGSTTSYRPVHGHSYSYQHLLSPSLGISPQSIRLFTCAVISAFLVVFQCIKMYRLDIADTAFYASTRWSTTWQAHLDSIPRDDSNYFIHIIHATDANHIKLVLVSIFSILETALTPERFRFHIVNTGPVDSIPQEWLSGCFPLRHEQIDITHWDGEEHLKDVNMHGGRSDLINAANFARFYFDDIFPSLDRMIFLDADTLAIRPIDRLWEIDLKGAPLGMVVECGGWFDHMYKSVFNATHPIVMDTFVGDELCYPNAGVLLMDQLEMTATRVRERVEAMIKANSEEFVYASGSQAPLVLALWKEFAHLPEEWNTRNHRRIQGASLMHFTGAYVKSQLRKYLTDIQRNEYTVGGFEPSEISSYTDDNKLRVWKRAAHSLAYTCRSSLGVDSPFVVSSEH